MDILDALRLAPSADLYRLYRTIGRMINDPKRILEVRWHLHIGMTVGYVADDLTQPLRQGRILELRQTQAVVQDIASGRHWSLPYAAVLAEPNYRRAATAARFTATATAGAACGFPRRKRQTEAVLTIRT